MENLLWWYWILLGIALVILELLIPSFTIFWFGLGALLTGVLMVLLPGLPFAWQLLCFSVASVGFTLLWFHFFRPRKPTVSAAAEESQAIGQTGIAATRVLTGGDTGKVVFSVPLLGRESWEYQADEPINTGDRVRIVAVLTLTGETGSNSAVQKLLKVEKIN